MKKTIIAATDFSASAFNAACYAVDMAKEINATVLLVHIYQLPVAFSEVPIQVNEEDIRKDADHDISKLRSELVERAEHKIDIFKKIECGSFHPTLAAICEEVSPYAVVMGSQGTTAAERLFFGSHVVYAMKHLQWPVISVPMKAGFSLIRQIGLACDFDNVVGTIPVEAIKGFLKTFHAQLHVINTGKASQFRSETVFEAGIFEKLMAEIKPEYHFIATGDTDEGIIDFAETNHIDLLMVVPKNHTLIDRLSHKSQTKQLALHSHIPVMAIHDQNI